jgi:hypothetical protein
MNVSLFDTRIPTPEDLLATIVPLFQPKIPAEQCLRNVLTGKPGGK